MLTVRIKWNPHWTRWRSWLWGLPLGLALIPELMGLKWTRSLHLLFPSQPPIRSCSGRGWVVWCSNLTWNLWLNFPPSRGISVVLCNSLKGICDSDYCEPDSTSLSYKKGEKMKKKICLCPFVVCQMQHLTWDIMIGKKIKQLESGARVLISAVHSKRSKEVRLLIQY